MKDFAALARARHSSRRFDGTRDVDEDILRRLLDVALLAPSWSNTQPFKIAVARGAIKDGLKAELTRRYDEGLHLQGKKGLGQLVAALKHPDGKPNGDFFLPLNYPEDLKPAAHATGRGLYNVLGIERGDRPARQAAMRRNFDFFDAPVALFVFVHEGLGVYGPLDAGFFLQNLALAAEEQGLGTCMQGALAFWSKPVHDAFQVDRNYKLLCGVSLGYEADHAVNSFRPDKKSIDDILLNPR